MSKEIKTVVKNLKKVVTGIVRFSYLFIFSPHSIADGQAEKYSASIIIKKSDTKTIEDCKKAIEEAYKEGQAKLSNGKTCPPLSSIKTPLRDGDVDRPDDPAYKDAYFINANAVKKPHVVDKDLNPIIDAEDAYSGCYGRASITFYAYNVNGNRGIACGLQNIQITEKGEALGTQSSAEDDFLPFADDDKKEDDFLK